MSRCSIARRARPTPPGDSHPERVTSIVSGFQAYVRQHRPPLLAIRGCHDPHFLPAGALAYRRDLPDAGHFALEPHAAEIGDAMRRFLTPLLVEATRG